MNDRILVAYASKAGSTAGVAERIGSILAAQGRTVDVLPVADIKDLTLYREVIFGTAIRAGRPLGEAVSFVEKNKSFLSGVDFHLFGVCLTLKEDTPENRTVVAAYLDPLTSLVAPKSRMMFAGVMDTGRLNFVERLIMKAMKAPSGDFRNWEAIDAWAQGFAP